MPRVAASGPLDARVVIVGEAPGKEEELKGEPFTGGSGRLLRQALRDAGIDPDKDVFWTNVCKERPPGNEIKQFFPRGVPNEHIMRGLFELKEEIAAVKPNLIIGLGNTALWALGGAKKGRLSKKGEITGISDWRGSVVEGNALADGRKVMFAYHPAAILRQYPLLAPTMVDLQKAHKEMKSPDIIRKAREIVINPQGTERSEMVKDLQSFPILTADIEYIRAVQGKLLSIAFAARNDKAYVLSMHSGEDYNLVRQLLTSGQPLCFQNAIFDCSVLEYWFDIPCMQHVQHDTLIASHVAYLELPKDLGFLCSIYTDIPCYWTGISWKEITAHILGGGEFGKDKLIYNGTDALVTQEVMECQLSDELKDRKVAKTYAHEMNLLVPLWEMGKRGIPVDLDAIEQMKTATKAKQESAQKELDLMAGRAINVKSGKDKTDLLINQLKMKPVAFTETNQVQLDDKALLKMLSKADPEQARAINLIRTIGDARDLQSKFTSIVVDPDGRMRTTYNPAGTVTGRISSKEFYPTGSGANLQNIPKDPLVRSVFVPTTGNVFFYNDLMRAESLLVAHITGDKKMLEIHEPGKDAHRITGAFFFDKNEADITKVERELGKMTRHASNYMMGPRGLQENINSKSDRTGIRIDLQTAEMLTAKYRRMHPRLPVWWDTVKVELKKTRTLYTMLGRPRTFYDRIDSCLPHAVAYIPQGTIGDLLNIGLMKCFYDEELKSLGVELFLQVHDALGGQVPANNVDKAMERIGQLMSVELQAPESGSGLRFTTPVELNVGKSWGEVTEWAKAA